MNKNELMIRDELIEQIRSGHFLPETTLPSENELADFYQVSRLTIRRVYNVLVEMGYIYSKRGVGHFVMARRKPIEVALRGDTSFTEKMKQQKIPYQSRTVRCEKISYDEKIFQTLGVDKEENVYQVARVRTIYNKRSALHLSYLTEKQFPKIAKEGLEIASIFDYYRSKGHQVFHSHHSKLSISFPTKEERELLDCHSLTPLLTIESDCFDKETNNILEYTRIIYRSDVLELSLAKVNS
jgi:GntR family transcriptional regulator